MFDARGRLWVADRGNGRVVHFAPDGTFLKEFGKPTSKLLQEDQVYQPNKLVIDRLRNDTQDRVLREDELKRAIAEFTQFSSARQQALNLRWNETTYRPKVSAYDTALSAASPPA